MVPMNPGMTRAMAATNAHVEAQRLEMEAESNTSDGRKKVAEAKLAERERKESDWLGRVIIDRGNGWKPIWGTAEDQELRIYTLVDGGEHRFWGIKPIGMGIDDFWDEYDPEVRRYEDRQQETPMNPDAPIGPLIGEPPRSFPPSQKVVAKPKKRQEAPEINPTQRVRKSITVSTSSKAKNSTRKSLADKIDAGQLTLEDQVREVAETAPASGRSTRNKKAIPASDAQQAATKDEGSAPSKRPRGRPIVKPKPVANNKDALSSSRPRGRPPIKEKLAQKPSRQKRTTAVKGKLVEKPPKQQKSTAVKGNARVTKSSQTERRPSKPRSTHKMRTRREGPAERLQLP
ncbi:MAG: hypothetical protein ASARMPRED_008902 [Alectoria sarmentosa]|nr:MAG: hypothetical protein ASARMPRED_008902 [Alectoria sarmentosa]